ncbi:hypothetical protein [Clostridium magnum]|uniref:DUF4316 domain-containing protein n=1 Tax=Clostridium magnum DSM 2767 TaxID=1121326 RepID=A0A162T0R1_9CLOT|nr:hypothetical protein [Clostridium magnum]KZL92100.1 hypothetical protein CLMAG_19060 [Clostridium magnum DSM 2767]SHH22434.1 hypothetical protein SAMN02745944_00322 [Clostridium magnum DSM 2767]
MTNDREHDREVEKRRLQEQNEHRLDQLIDTVENYTRTERHLEQYSDIGDPKNRAHARDIQAERKAEIQHIKNNIVYGAEYDDHPLENLKENYDDTKEYLEHFGSRLDEKTLSSVEEKQKNREMSIHQMEHE